MINRYAFQRYDGRPDDARDLAKYLIKEAARNVREGKQKLRWVGSKNLTPPKVIYRTIHAKAWRERPAPPKGMELICIENFWTADGYPVQLARYVERRNE